jgi:hypothetical protein
MVSTHLSRLCSPLLKYPRWWRRHDSGYMATVPTKGNRQPTRLESANMSRRMCTRTHMGSSEDTRARMIMTSTAVGCSRWYKAKVCTRLVTSAQFIFRMVLSFLPLPLPLPLTLVLNKGNRESHGNSSLLQTTTTCLTAHRPDTRYARLLVVRST